MDGQRLGTGAVLVQSRRVKRIHMESRLGRRGHKWFPNGASPRHMEIQKAGLIATLLAVFSGRRK